jgi:pilus assembly protein Flp/PilA
MRERLTAFMQDERGAALIEYSLVAALIALGMLATLADLGATLGQLYETIRLGLASVAASG